MSWQLPFSMPWLIAYQCQSDTLNFNIYAPRVIAFDADVWGAIFYADIGWLRQLFEARQASVYDVNLDGHTLLAVSSDAARVTMPRLTQQSGCMLLVDAITLGGFS